MAYSRGSFQSQLQRRRERPLRPPLLLPPRATFHLFKASHGQHQIYPHRRRRGLATWDSRNRPDGGQRASLVRFRRRFQRLRRRIPWSKHGFTSIQRSLKARRNGARHVPQQRRHSGQARASRHVFHVRRARRWRPASPALSRRRQHDM